VSSIDWFEKDRIKLSWSLGNDVIADENRNDNATYNVTW